MERGEKGKKSSTRYTSMADKDKDIFIATGQYMIHMTEGERERERETKTETDTETETESQRQRHTEREDIYIATGL